MHDSLSLPCRVSSPCPVFCTHTRTQILCFAPRAHAFLFHSIHVPTCVSASGTAVMERACAFLLSRGTAFSTRRCLHVFGVLSAYVETHSDSHGHTLAPTRWCRFCMRATRRRRWTARDSAACVPSSLITASSSLLVASLTLPRRASAVLRTPPCLAITYSGLSMCAYSWSGCRCVCVCACGLRVDAGVCF